MKFLNNNVKPACFVTMTTCIGFLFGSPLVGLIIGVLIVAAATVFL